MSGPSFCFSVKEEDTISSTLRLRDFLGVVVLLVREERRAWWWRVVDRVVLRSMGEMGSNRKSGQIGISSSDVVSSSEESYKSRVTAILDAKF